MGICDVKVARDGREAVNMLLGDESQGLPPQIELPSILLLDLRLPKLDGLEVLKKIRDSELTRNLPVYVLTSSEDPHDKEVCGNLGVIAFITKPLSVDSFQTVLPRSSN
jgi:CheY-like chemotaxis protein